MLKIIYNVREQLLGLCLRLEHNDNWKIVTGAAQKFLKNT